MKNFTEVGRTYTDAVNKAKNLHGDRVVILGDKTVRYGGVLGLFQKEGVEVSGYINEVNNFRRENFDKEKKKIIAAASTQKNDKYDTVLEKLENMNKTLERFSTDLPNEKEHDNITKIEEILVKNDFTHSFIKNITTRLKSEISLEQLSDIDFVKEKTLEWIIESIKTYKRNYTARGNVEVILGPTGVGKTTTIAKIAAVHSLGMKGCKTKDVRMINTDNYRMGAKVQIEKYGEIIKIPIANADSLSEFRNKLNLFCESDLIIVDTMGRSPKDYQILAQMREMLDVCNDEANKYLTLSATTKTEDIKNIIKEFSLFGINAVILTKLDETSCVGNLISVLQDANLPIVYIADGQSVPQDLFFAEKQILINRLQGFNLKNTINQK